MEKIINIVPGHPNVQRIEKKDGKVLFLKQSPNGQVMRELQDYALLSKYGIPVPKARILPDGHRLLMEFAGVSVDDLFVLQPKLGLSVFQQALTGLSYMWEQTKAPFCTQSVQRDYLQGSLKTLDILFYKDFSFSKKKLFINGKEFPVLLEAIVNCKEKLQNSSENIMVISHGDEYSLNIMAEQVGGIFTGNYKVIDPRDSGYYGLSAILNILLGQTLLHSFPRFVEVEMRESSNNITINYSIKEPLIYGDFLRIVDSLLERVAGIGDFPLLPVYLFCNLARTIEPATYLEKYRYKIHPARFFFYALAHELFYKQNPD